jgi:hypothetical protein
LCVTSAAILAGVTYLRVCIIDGDFANPDVETPKIEMPENARAYTTMEKPKKKQYTVYASSTSFSGVRFYWTSSTSAKLFKEDGTALEFTGTFVVVTKEE